MVLSEPIPSGVLKRGVPEEQIGGRRDKPYRHGRANDREEAHLATHASHRMMNRILAYRIRRCGRILADGASHWQERDEENTCRRLTEETHRHRWDVVGSCTHMPYRECRRTPYRRASGCPRKNAHNRLVASISRFVDPTH